MRVVLALLTGICVVGVGAVYAQAPAQPAPDPRIEEAKRAFLDAKQAYDVGMYDAAAVGFERAYRLTGDPVLLFNLAQARRQAGDLAEAVLAYRVFLRQVQEGDPRRADVEAKIAELETEIALGPDKPRRPVDSRPSDVVDPFAGAAPRAPVPPPALALARPAPARAPAVDLTAKPAPTFEPAAPAFNLRKNLPLITGGAAGAFALGAIVAGLATNARLEELRDSCGKFPGGCSDGDIGGVLTRARVTNVLWVLAGLSAAATGAIVYVDHRGGGLALGGTF